MSQLKPAISAADNIHGNAEARITLVEYGDYQCPYCRKAHPIVQNLMQLLGDDLRFVFRNFPLTEMHPNAYMAAVATEAAKKQNKFWEMHDMIYENQDKLSAQGLIDFAENLQLDLAMFKSDLENETLLQKVEADFESGVKSGVNGTPTFFINGTRFNANWEGESLYHALKSELRNAHA